MQCGASLRRGENPALAPAPPETTSTRAGPSPGQATQYAVPSQAAGITAAIAAPTSGQATDYAGFWWRYLATFLDSFLIGAVTNLIGFMHGILIGVGGIMTDTDESAVSAILMLMGILTVIVAGWLYEALMVSSSYQATLGKMAVGMVVTDMQGRRISFLRATGRHFGRLLSLMLFLIGYLIQPFTEKRQALHDMMAGCLVLRKVTR